MGRHRAPSRWRRTPAVVPAVAALSTAAVALTASTGPLAVVSSVEVTTGSLPIVSPTDDPPTVILPRLDPAEVAAEVLETARHAAPTTTTVPSRPRTPDPVAESVAKSGRVVAESGTLQQRIVQAARGYVGQGIPYRYGGKTCTASAGCDCSALVWHILWDVGMDVSYRNSAGLKAWAKPVSKANAVPGDLILWRGHVGIFMGDGMLIDHGGPGKGANYRKIWSGRGTPTFGRIPSSG